MVSSCVGDSECCVIWVDEGEVIGSHLCESLLADGINVVGIDAFIPYYPADVKRKNLQPALEHSRFEFQELDLRTDSLDAALEGADTAIHLAAMPGLRRSWSEFELYSSCNHMVISQDVAVAGVNYPCAGTEITIGKLTHNQDHRRFGKFYNLRSRELL